MLAKASCATRNSAVYTEGGDYGARARQHLDTLYNFGNSLVLFKPPLAAEDKFRGTDAARIFSPDPTKDRCPAPCI